MIRQCHSEGGRFPEAPRGWDFGLDGTSYPEELEAAQSRACSEPVVRAVAYPGEETPPFHAHIYLSATPHQIGAGVVWRNDRWPTTGEIAHALAEWRGRIPSDFDVSWWDGTEGDSTE